MARNETMQAVKEFIRQPNAFPGGYPKALFMTDGECLCAKCAKENYRLISTALRTDDKWSGWHPFGVDIYWEGAPIICAHCGGQIESAYGEPENDE